MQKYKFADTLMSLKRRELLYSREPMKLIDRGLQKQGSKSEFLLVASISLLIVLILLLRTDIMTYENPNFVNPWDHHKYIRMAADGILDFHIAPFCWRIIDPLIARFLPFDLQLNFLIISFISIWMTGVMIYYISKLFNFPKTFPFIGMFMFFSLGYATKHLLYDFWLPDSLSFLFIALAIYYILTKKDMNLVAILIMGVAVKESVIFVSPLYYTFNAHKIIDIRIAKRLVLLISPAFAVLIILRILIPQMNNDLSYLNTLPEILRGGWGITGSYNYYNLVKEIGLQRLDTQSLDTLKSYSVGTFGAMIMFLALVSIRKNLKLFLKFIPFLLLVYSQLLFAVNTERLLVMGFPVMILFALYGIDEIAKICGIKSTYLIMMPLIMLSLNLIETGSPSASVENQLLVFLIYISIILQAG